MAANREQLSAASCQFSVTNTQTPRKAQAATDFHDWHGSGIEQALSSNRMGQGGAPCTRPRGGKLAASPVLTSA